MGFGNIYDKFNFFHAEMGNSKFLVARFTNGTSPIPNQMETVSTISSQNLLKGTRNTNGNFIEILYDVTGKIRLTDIIGTKKMTDDDFYTFVIGILNAINELERYNLPHNGLVLEHDFIYIDQNTFEPFLMFVPAFDRKGGMPNISEYLNRIVYAGLITNNENSSRVINVFSSSNLSTAEYLRLIVEMKMNPQSFNSNSQPIQYNEISYNPVNSTNQDSYSQSIDAKPTFMKKVQEQSNYSYTPINNNYQQSVQMQVQGKSVNEKEMQVNNSMTKQNKENKNNKQKEIEVNNKQKEQSYGWKIILMAIIQIIFISAIGVMGFKGMLNTKSGDINLPFTVMLLILVVAIDVILYAVFFGSKKEKVVYEQQIRRNNSTSTSGPKYMSEVINNKDTSNTSNQNQNNQNHDNNQNNNFANNSHKTQGEVSNPYVSNPDDTEVEPTVYDEDDTVVIAPQITSYPFLEYEEGGEIKKIVINKSVFIIGRLHGKVDYISTNKKISKIHAEIISRGNCYYIKDFNSTNKTYVNRGSAITPDVENQIFDKDMISFADSEYVFRIPQ